jgi:hypothetical protein
MQVTIQRRGGPDDQGWEMGRKALKSPCWNYRRDSARYFYGNVNGQNVPISMSGKVLAGQYKGSMLDTLAQDIQNENSATPVDAH